VALAPGLYQVRVVAREEGTTHLGSASEWIEVPDLATGKLALSSVFLSTPPAATPPAAAGSVSGDKEPAAAPAAASAKPEPLRDMQALKRFHRDDNLNFQLFIYNAARDASGAADVILQAQVWAGPRML